MMRRDPGLFVWEECGRSFVASFGRLSISVVGRGSAAKGTKVWRVGEIFGNSHLGGGGWKQLDDAILEAEGIAVREGRALFGSMREALVPGRRMPMDPSKNPSKGPPAPRSPGWHRPRRVATGARRAR